MTCASTVAALRRRLRPAAAPVLVFLVCLALVGVTMGQVGATVDEPLGFYLGVAKLLHWSAEVQRRSPLDRDLRDAYWPLSTAASQRGVKFFNHPPTARYMGWLGWQLFSRVMPGEYAMRMGSALAFSLAAAVLYAWIRREYDWHAALFAVCALVGTPRVFAHAHVLATDTQVLAWSAASLYLFWCLRERFTPARFALYVLVLALLILAKVTAIFTLFVLGVWTVARRAWRLLAAFPLAALGAYALNPAFWLRPPQAVLQSYLLDHLHRNDFICMASYYFGVNSYCWHYPLGMILLTTPALVLLGVAAGLRPGPGKGPLHLLLISPVVVFVALMMKPGIFQYDGVRLFLVVFAFLAAVAGVGVARLRQMVANRSPRPWVGQALTPALALLLVLPTALASPYYMSYYNELVGGLAGAHRWRLESTYWLDALNEDAMARINAALPVGASLYLTPFDYQVSYYLATGRLRRDLRQARDRADADYILLYCRLAVVANDRELWTLYRTGEPILEGTCQGVPLWRLYACRKPIPTTP